jgi:hypothetical protein
MFADRASTMTKMVTTVDGGHIPAISGEFGDDCSNAMAV